MIHDYYCGCELLLYTQDDPEAHKKFLRVNRAYEVLKDEDLRKKYDMYGEDGLKEGGPTGHSYQSWSFYNQDFGVLNSVYELMLNSTNKLHWSYICLKRKT